MNKYFKIIFSIWEKNMKAFLIKKIYLKCKNVF